MSKIIYEFKIGPYVALQLDNMPNEPYMRYQIEDEVFEPIPINDMPNCIAIKSSKSFLGKEVEFV